MGISNNANNSVTDFVRVENYSTTGTVLKRVAKTIDVSNLSGTYYLKILTVHGGQSSVCTAFTDVYRVSGR